MTRADMVAKLSESVSIDKKLCTTLIDSLQEEIIKTVCKEGKVIQNGFGTFSAATTDWRKGRNLHTGQKMLYPPKRKIKFKLSNVLKESINQGGANE